MFSTYFALKYEINSKGKKWQTAERNKEKKVQVCSIHTNNQDKRSILVPGYYQKSCLFLLLITPLQSSLQLFDHNYEPQCVASQLSHLTSPSIMTDSTTVNPINRFIIHPFIQSIYLPMLSNHIAKWPQSLFIISPILQLPFFN